MLAFEMLLCGATMGLKKCDFKCIHLISETSEFSLQRLIKSVCLCIGTLTFLRTFSINKDFVMMASPFSPSFWYCAHPLHPMGKNWSLAENLEATDQDWEAPLPLLNATRDQVAIMWVLDVSFRFSMVPLFYCNKGFSLTRTHINDQILLSFLARPQSLFLLFIIFFACFCLIINVGSFISYGT